MKRILSVLCASLILGSIVFLIPATPLSAQETAAEVAELVPIDVSEVVSAGHWKDKGKEGVFRVVSVISTDGDDLIAQVFAQWLYYPEDEADPEILRNVEITEVTKARVPEASLTLDEEDEGQATLVVSAYDSANDKEILLGFRLSSQPGKYKPAPVESSSSAQ